MKYKNLLITLKLFLQMNRQTLLQKHHQMDENELSLYLIHDHQIFAHIDLFVYPTQEQHDLRSLKKFKKLK